MGDDPRRAVAPQRPLLLQTQGRGVRQAATGHRCGARSASCSSMRNGGAAARSPSSSSSRRPSRRLFCSTSLQRRCGLTPITISPRRARHQSMHARAAHARSTRPSACTRVGSNAAWLCPKKKIHHSVASSCVCRVNFDALRCDFSKFNHTLLLSWQHWRGEFTRQRKLLNYRTFEELRRRCFTAGNVRRGRKRPSIVCPSEPTPLSANLNQPHRRNGSHVCVSATHVRCLHVLS